MSRVYLDHRVARVVGHPVEARGGPAELIRFELPDWVNVVAVDEDERLVLVRQHRFGVDAVTLEIPGGMVDPGEAPLDAARRELAEETGYTGGTWTPLGVLWPNPALQDNRLHCYLARGVRRTRAPSPDPDEVLTVALYSWEQTEEALRSGEIAHALVAVALERALRAQ